MKKLFTVCLIAATMYSFVGCGKEDNAGNDSDDVDNNPIEAPAKKVKKISIEGTNGHTLTEAYYQWNGNKLMSISFKDDYYAPIEFTYSEGKLSSMTMGSESFTYTWNGNKIATETIHGGGQDGVVSTYEYTGDKVTKIKQMNYDAYKITWTGDNIETIEYFSEPFCGPISYDNQHNPLYMPCGQVFFASRRSALIGLIHPSWSKNNSIDNPYFYTNGDGSSGPIEYTYDSDGFPTTAKVGSTLILRYEY